MHRHTDQKTKYVDVKTIIGIVLLYTWLQYMHNKHTYLHVVHIKLYKNYKEMRNVHESTELESETF